METCDLQLGEEKYKKQIAAGLRGISNERIKRVHNNSMIGLALAAALAITAPIDGAQAQGVISCDFAVGVTCLWGQSDGGLGKVITVPPSTDTERERVWEDRCEPGITIDRYGVSRYRYLHPGCEFGR